MNIDPLQVEQVVPDAKLGIGRKFTPIKIVIIAAVVAVVGGATYVSLNKKPAQPTNPLGTVIPANFNPTAPVQVPSAMSASEPALAIAGEAPTLQTVAASPSVQSAPGQPVIAPIAAQTPAPAVLPVQASTAATTAMTSPVAPIAQPAPAAEPVLLTPTVPAVEEKTSAPVKTPRKEARKAKPAPKKVAKPVVENTATPEKPEAPTGELVTTEEILIIQ